MANIKTCTKCGKIGLDQYDFGLFFDNRDNKFYYNSKCKKCRRKEVAQWYKEHKKYRKKYCENNRKRYQELKEQHYQNNKKHYQRLNKQWKINNKDKVNAQAASRKAMKLNQTPVDANMVEIQKIYSICALINEISVGIKWHVDHIIPLSKGGPHHQDNLQILESIANLRKGSRILKEKAENV